MHLNTPLNPTAKDRRHHSLQVTLKKKEKEKDLAALHFPQDHTVMHKYNYDPDGPDLNKFLLGLIGTWTIFHSK